MSEQIERSVLDDIHLLAYAKWTTFLNYVHTVKLDEYKLGSLNTPDENGMVKINLNNLLSMLEHISDCFKSIKEGIEAHFEEQSLEGKERAY